MSQVSVKALVAGVQQLDLDTSGIAIAAVSLHSAAGEAAPLEYELAPPHKVSRSRGCQKTGWLWYRHNHRSLCTGKPG